MKKHKGLFVLLVVMVAVLAAALSACDLFGDDNDQPPAAPAEYIIQYTDDTGMHQITVDAGAPYSIPHIPSRIGYEFVGLYDAEQGGVQYVNAQGSSVSVFNDNRNIVLFPQFKVKEYTIVFDYGDAFQTGIGSMKVLYGQELLDFPGGVIAENKVFQGWFTLPNCRGTKIADSSGRIVGNKLFTVDLFENAETFASVTVYAGFVLQTYPVTFIYGQDESVTVDVEHGTKINNVALPARADGKKVTQWATASDGKVFDDVVTSDMELIPHKWSWTKTFSRTTQMKITDDGYGGKNYYDTVNPAAMFGKTSTSELWASAGAADGTGGYTSASVTVVLSVREIDDGYQWIKVCSVDSAGKDAAILFEQRFEHGPGKADKNSYTHTFKFDVSMPNLTNNLHNYYKGTGDWDDDWMCESVKFTITLNQ